MMLLVMVLSVLAFGFSVYTFLRTPKMGEHTHAPISLVDMSEFRQMPADLKKSYTDNVVNKVAPAFHRVLSSAWATNTEAERAEMLLAISTQADAAVVQLDKLGAMIQNKEYGKLMKMMQRRTAVLAKSKS